MSVQPNISPQAQQQIESRNPLGVRDVAVAAGVGAVLGAGAAIGISSLLGVAPLAAVLIGGRVAQKTVTHVLDF